MRNPINIEMFLNETGDSYRDHKEVWRIINELEMILQKLGAEHPSLVARVSIEYGPNPTFPPSYGDYGGIYFIDLKNGIVETDDTPYT